MIPGLSAGGIGEVWKARDARLYWIVAIKRLKARKGNFPQPSSLPDHPARVFFCFANRNRVGVSHPT